MTNNGKTSAIKLTIIILSVLLALSLFVITFWHGYKYLFGEDSTKSVAPDNNIGESTPPESVKPDTSVPPSEEPSETEEPKPEDSVKPAKVTKIELNSKQPDENKPFKAQNMLPGDSVAKSYKLKISHHSDVVVYFTAPVKSETNDLSEILTVRITHVESDTVLYDGAFRDMDEEGYIKVFTASDSTVTEATYNIEVSLPTSAGNKYQGAALIADFVWTVKDTAPLDPPQTGDNGLLLWMIAGISLILVIFLVFYTKRRREYDDE